jgi:hypothetical protein
MMHAEDAARSKDDVQLRHCCQRNTREARCASRDPFRSRDDNARAVCYRGVAIIGLQIAAHAIDRSAEGDLVEKS